MFDIDAPLDESHPELGRGPRKSVPRATSRVAPSNLAESA